MKQVLCISAIALGLLVALTGCAQATSDTSTGTAPATAVYTMSILPAKLTTPIPASLKATSADVVVGSARAIAQPLAVKKETSSMACQLLRGMTTSMKSIGSFSGLMAIITDSALKENSAKFRGDTNESKDVTVTITKEMVAAIANVSDGDQNDADITNMINQQLQVSIAYTNTNAAPYENKAEITIETMTATIEWNNDKTKSKLTMDMGDSSAITFIYNDTLKQATVEISVSGIFYNVTLRTLPTSTLLYSTMNVSGSIYTIKGLADDQGGFAKITMITSPPTAPFTEYFDKNGNTAADNAAYLATYTLNSSTFTDLAEETPAYE